MLLQEDVHSLLTPLFFLLPRCLQTLPVCNMILWQSIGFSFDGMILHVTPTEKPSLCHSLLMDFKNKALSTEELRLQHLSPLVRSLKGLL